MGLPDTAAGTITSGGSVSILSAMVVARRKLLGEEFSKGVVYCTPQTHFSLYKALQVRASLKVQSETSPWMGTSV